MRHVQASKKASLAGSRNDRPRGRGLNLPPRLLTHIYMAFGLQSPGRARRLQRGARGRLAAVTPGRARRLQRGARAFGCTRRACSRLRAGHSVWAGSHRSRAGRRTPPQDAAGSGRHPRTPPAGRHPQDAPPGTPPYAAAFPQGAGPQAVSLQQARRARAPPRPGLPQADAAAKARPARMAAQPSNRPRYRHGSPPELQIPPHELEQIGRPIPTRAR